MWRRMWIVFSKEVLDNARDKRSLLVAFIYPLLGPILLGTMIAVVSRVAVDAPTQGMVLPVAGAEHAPELVSWLEERRVTVVPSPGEPHTAVRRGIAEAIVVVPAEFRGAFDNEKPAPISVVVNSSRLSGLVQMNRVATILSDFNQAIWGERISARGIDHRSLQPLMIESVNVTTGAHIADIFLFMVPPLFIFNLFMGGVYLSIDTTSGERERGSLEPLLINPVERWVLMGGKFFAALFYTTIAVVAQLLALAYAFKAAGGPDSTFTYSLGAPELIVTFLVSFPLMLVAVAVQFLIATMTRSFKEAQTYLGLLPLVPALPGMVLVFAPVKAHVWMMAIPAFSQTLLLGEVMRGEALDLIHLGISVVSTTLCAAAIVYIVARLYEREELVFGG